jgi:hypothetical protein
MSAGLTRTIVRSASRMMRFPIFAAAAIAGLCLFCSGAQTARMWMPKTDNPYCNVDTYMLRDVPEQALSTHDSNGVPVIVVNATTLADNPPYGRFLMAHECCHHTLGHVGRFESLGQVGPQPFFYIAPALKQMELDADCCAIKMLKSKNDTDSIKSAREMMMSFGSNPTGAYYPTGIERVDNIDKCAAED